MVGMSTFDFFKFYFRRIEMSNFVANQYKHVSFFDRHSLCCTLYRFFLTRILLAAICYVIATTLNEDQPCSLFIPCFVRCSVKKHLNKCTLLSKLTDGQGDKNKDFSIVSFSWNKKVAESKRRRISIKYFRL